MAKDSKPKKGEAYTQVLLEEIRDQISTVAEGVDGNSQRLVRVEKKLGDVDERLIRVEDLLKSEIPLIRKQISELQDSLTEKADVARLEVLEARVDRLERSTAGA